MAYRQKIGTRALSVARKKEKTERGLSWSRLWRSVPLFVFFQKEIRHVSSSTDVGLTMTSTSQYLTNHVLEPQIYNRFKKIRYQPFFDLADLIRPPKKWKLLTLAAVQKSIRQSWQINSKTQLIMRSTPPEVTAEVIHEAATKGKDLLSYHECGAATRSPY